MLRLAGFAAGGGPVARTADRVGWKSPIDETVCPTSSPVRIAIAVTTGIEQRATLYSSTEFKKVRMLYFTDDFRRWEEENS